MKNIFTMIACFVTLLSQPALSQTLFFEDFESTTNGQLPAGWAGTTSTTGAWKAGPSSDFYVPGAGYALPHTKFAGLTVDTVYQAIARTDYLTLPTIPLQNTATYTDLTVMMDLYNLVINTLSLEVSFNGGVNWTIVQYLPNQMWGPVFFAIPPVVNQSSMMLRIKHVCNAGDLYLGLYIDNIEVYDAGTADAAIYDVLPYGDTLRNVATATQGVPIIAKVLNKTGNPITNMALKYKLDNGAVQTDMLTGLNIAGHSLTTLTHNIPCVSSMVGQHSLTVWVELAGDADNSNDTGATKIMGASFIPLKRPLIEERGGTWCSWCVRGIFYTDSLNDIHGDTASIISVHNDDPMMVHSYDSFMTSLTVGGIPMSALGYPHMATDRRRATLAFDYIFWEYDDSRANFGFGELSIGTATLVNGNLSLTGSFKPAIDMAGSYRLALVLTEDSVHKDSTLYWQANAYSYMLFNQPFFGYENLPHPIPAADMYHMHVARVAPGGEGGAPGSLPAQMTHGNTYNYTFTTVLDTSWKVPQMKAVLMLVDGSNNIVLNTNNRKIMQAVGVSSVKENSVGIDIYPNPASDVVYVSLTTGNITNVKARLSDMFGRDLYSKDYGILQPGMQSFTIPVKGLVPGIYNLRVETGTGTASRMITVTD